ncbi:MAG: hypothetical protein NZ602_02015 [Thermoguttaceae bacterium]|nr:hypothetical protein [Thermoguttaceae bacterium]MDW8038706.1 hypothetical protein [Thermoguttaceae bacterium]
MAQCPRLARARESCVLSSFFRRRQDPSADAPSGKDFALGGTQRQAGAVDFGRYLLPHYGPKVQGAALHRNPSPGPGEGAFCYGHCWVSLACGLRPAHWDTVAVPLGSKLYVRQEDMQKLPAGGAFRTKPQLGLELILEVVQELQNKGLEVVVVQDGAWTHRQYICRLRKAGLVVVGRLRKDAPFGTCCSLWDLPPPRRPG